MALAATEQDQEHLWRTIELAKRGHGQTSPNPLVGAVVARGGEQLGEGWHTAFGEPHAEVEALKACKVDPIGATLYVSLEPCCHEGKTPPCTKAIVEAGIGRVVVASDDPTEKASGRCLGVLRDEGIEVVVADGEVAAAARLLNQPFRKHARVGRPHVILKTAMSLDGKVATSTGDSQWISSEVSRRRAHRWRADSDAVCIGIGTATADDPLLTARVEAVAKQPARVIFDSEARLSLSSQLVASAANTPLIVIASRAASRNRLAALEDAGVGVLVASGENEAARVVNGLDELGARRIQSLLLEGGPHLAGAFLDAGEVDEMRVFIAPIAIGGRRAKDPVEGEGAAKLDDAMRALAVEHESLGDDLLITARLREW